MNLISSASCTCIAILLIGVIPPVPQICGYTHWTVSQYDMIESLTSSYYHLRQSWDLIELLRQERSWHLVEHLERTLERVSNELASTERRQARLERRYSNRDGDCTAASRLIAQRELHPSHILTLEEVVGVSSIDLLQPNLLHQWPSIESAELWQPLCTRLFEAPEFSMCCFEHLVSMRNRSTVTGAPEPAVRERAIPPSLTTAEYGHLVTLALLEGGRHDPQRAWMLFNMAAFFWRARGDARNASECLRAALYFSPWQQREVALVGLAGVLRRSGTSLATRDALVLMQNALLLAPRRPNHHLILGALFDALNQPRDALQHYERAALLLRATPIDRDNTGLIKELEERSRAARCSVEAAVALTGQQDALDRQLDRLEAFQRDVSRAERARRELRERALDNSTQQWRETGRREFIEMDTDEEGVASNGRGQDDHSLLASVFGSLEQRNKARGQSLDGPDVRGLITGGTNKVEQSENAPDHTQELPDDMKATELSRGFQYCMGDRDTTGVTMSAIGKNMIGGGHGDGIGNDNGASIEKDSGEVSYRKGGEESERGKLAFNAENREKKMDKEDTIENGDNERTNRDGNRVMETEQNEDEKVIMFSEEAKVRENRAEKHDSKNSLENGNIVNNKECEENNVKNREVRVNDGPMNREQGVENLETLSNIDETSKEQKMENREDKPKNKDNTKKDVDDEATKKVNYTSRKIRGDNQYVKPEESTVLDSSKRITNNNQIEARESATEQVADNKRVKAENNENYRLLTHIDQDKQHTVNDKNRKRESIRSKREDNAMATIYNQQEKQNSTNVSSRGLEGSPPPIRMNVSLCDRLACDPVATGDRSDLTEVPVVLAGFLTPIDKGLDLDGLLTIRQGLSQLERSPLPWYPPICAGHVNNSSLRREVLLETLEVLSNSSKGLGFKPNDRLNDDANLSRILWDMVGGDRAVPLADIGQRVLTALERRLAPHWIVLQLAALYWRVVGEPGPALECLQLALRSSPTQFRGVALFNLAALLARLRFHSDAIKLVAAALQANRSEPASHMLAAQLQLMHGRLQAAFHHVSVALRQDSSRPLGPTLLQLVSCKLCLKHSNDNANWNQALKFKTLKRNVTQIFINYKMCSSTAECDNIIGKNYQYLPHVKVHIKGPTFSPLDIKNLNTDLYSLNHHVTRPNIMYGILWNTNFSNLHIQGHECLLINDTSRSVGCHLNEEIFEASQNAVNFLTELRTLLENVSSHLSNDANSVIMQDNKQHLCLGKPNYVSKAPPLLVGSSSLEKATNLIAPKSIRNSFTPKDCENVTPFNFKLYTPLHISLNTMRFNVAFFVDSLKPGYTFSFSQHPYCVPSGDNFLRRVIEKYQIDFRSIPESKDPDLDLRVSFLQTFGDKYTLDEIGEKLYAGLHSNSTDWRLATINVNYWRVVGDAREAFNCLELALENGPEFYEKVLLVNAANILYKINLLEAAIEVTEKSMQYPDSKNWVVIPFLMANIFAAMEQWQRAMVFYEACLSVKADFKEAIYRIKSIHCQHIFPESLNKH